LLVLLRTVTDHARGGLKKAAGRAVTTLVILTKRSGRHYRSRQSLRAFTLVELMVVVAIVGTLASLSSYGVRKYSAAAKSVEAVTAVGNIGMAVRIAADREIMSSDVLALGATSTKPTSTPDEDSKVTGSTSGKGKGQGATVTHGVDTVEPGLCASSEPVPASLNSIKGRKYQPKPSDYLSGDARSGWRCLLFSFELPQYYQYQYTGGGGSPISVKLPHGGTPKGLKVGNLWTATAQGDLDGDGVTSWFVLNGYLDVDGRIVTAPAIGTDQPEE
jgi:prepilin-type N-terminal cleavage/methylation domain-containing protein